jgi:hypothetical protein
MTPSPFLSAATQSRIARLMSAVNVSNWFAIVTPDTRVRPPAMR